MEANSFGLVESGFPVPGGEEGADTETERWGFDAKGMDQARWTAVGGRVEGEDTCLWPCANV